MEVRDMVARVSTENSHAYTTVSVADGAEAFVEALVMYGVERVFLNSGTDTFPIQEAMARRSERGLTIPDVILCLDESMALSAAQGHFQVTGKTQVVLVHVDAGTAQLGGALHNAQRSQSGVLICAGRAPSTFLDEVPGGRDLPIHWIQEQRDQSSIVRTFTKWENELRRAESTGFVVHRALQVASAAPAGPVYLVLPRESLMQPLEGGLVMPNPARHPLPIPPSADPEAIESIAAMLVAAESPLIIAGGLGRDAGAIDALVELARMVGARVATGPTRMGFPTDDPHWAGASAENLVPDADVILIVDSDVPWIPSKAQPRPDAKIARIDIDPIKESIPMWSFPSDFVVHTDSARALPALVESVGRTARTQETQAVHQRSSAIEAEHRARARRLEGEDRKFATVSPITPEWLIRSLADTLPPDALILEETVTNRPRVHEVLPRTREGGFLVSGGASLGWALGAAVGAKLARPETTIVALVGDGTFIYCAPTSALWSADRYDAPFLTIIFNNNEHFATRRSLLALYPDSASERAGSVVGIDISPSPDYALLAEASRAYGERVSDPEQVSAAIQRGLDRVAEGQAAVIDVQLSRP
jgi:acetolactate synthase-1/2/3 large subunit